MPWQPRSLDFPSPVFQVFFFFSFSFLKNKFFPVVTAGETPNSLNVEGFKKDFFKIIRKTGNHHSNFGILNADEICYAFGFSPDSNAPSLLCGCVIILF